MTPKHRKPTEGDWAAFFHRRMIQMLPFILYAIGSLFFLAGSLITIWNME